MTTQFTPPKTLTAQQLKGKANILKRQASSLHVDLPAPGFPADAFAPPLDPSEPTDEVNLLLLNALDAPMRLAIPDWAHTSPPGEFDYLVLQWDGQDVDGKSFSFPHDPNDLYATIPREIFASAATGPHRVSYIVYNYDGNAAPSVEVVVLVDKEKPNFGNTPGPVVFPPLVVTEGVTAKYLADNNDVLTGTIPHYNGQRRGDRLFVYWGRGLAGDNDLVPATVFTVIDNNAPSVIQIPGDVIRARGEDGPRFTVYAIVDRAGNDTPLSLAVSLRVYLSPPPSGLKTPRVLAAEDESGAPSIIKLAEAQLGVELQFEDYVGYQTTDLADIFWENQVIRNQPVIGSVPFRFPIPWSVLSAGGVESRTFEVYYAIKRSPTAAPVESAHITVGVDFEVVGPPNPGPGPINDDLLLPNVKGGAWQTGDPLNVLTQADSGLDATAEVVLIAGFASTETLDLYWGNLSDPVDTVTLAGEGDGDTIEFTVPWDAIESGGFGAEVEVYYRVSDGTVDGNGQESNRQKVDSRIASIGPFRDPTFPDAYFAPGSPIPRINCAAEPWNGIKMDFAVDPEAPFELKDTVSLSFKAYVGSDFLVEIPGAEKDFSYTLNQTDVDRGFQLLIQPWGGFLELIEAGWVPIQYTVTRDTGQTGASARSTLRISRESAGGFCSPTF